MMLIPVNISGTFIDRMNKLVWAATDYSNILPI